MTGKEVMAVDWQTHAEAAAREEKYVSGQLISVRGGQLSVGDQALPGNQICAVVVDSIRENTYYAGEWDPDNVQPPTCYAFGHEEGDMAPHPSMQADPNHFIPQHEECTGCPMNEWGSALKGRGKACQNRRRLALLPAGLYTPIQRSRDFDLELYNDEEHYRVADLAFMKLPVTSTKTWASYVNRVAADLRRPPFGVITRVSVEPDAGSQYKVYFETIAEIPDEHAAAVLRRHEQARESIIRPYAPPRDA